MKHIFHKALQFLLLSLFLVLSVPVAGQPYLDDQVLLATNSLDNLELKITQGYRVFISTTNQLNVGHLTIFEDYFLNNQEGFLCLVLLDSAKGLVTTLRDNDLYKKTYIPKPSDQYYGIPISNHPQLYVFSYGIGFIPITEHIYFFGEKGTDAINNLTLINDLGGSQDVDNIKSLPNSLGKLPNFIVTRRPELIASLIDSMNNLKFYSAIVAENEKKIQDVLWQGNQSLSSSGKVHHSQVRVRPYKRGYVFSPDVINFNEVNSETIKVFQAKKLSLKDGLVLYLDFDKNVMNHDGHAPLFEQLSYVNDDIQGWFGFFQNRNHYVDFGQILNNSLKEISVSVWVKSDNLQGQKSIVGAGDVFTTKISDGKMCFTIPGEYDYVIQQPLLQIGKWYHLTYVYGADHNVHFYLNGQLVASQKTTGISFNNQSLLIATNLWDEYFSGAMNDLYLWERALSSKEVNAIYQGTHQRSDNWMAILKWIASGGVIVLGWLIHRMRKKLSSRQPETLPILPLSTTCNIELFGDFRLYDKEHNDISAQFSPQRQELFLIILFHTIQQGGISSRRMSDLLWEGYDFESAKNNRSTQISRLRNLLAIDTGIAIQFENPNWKMVLEEGITCDLIETLNTINGLGNAKSTKNIQYLLQQLEKGPLLPYQSYEWLDSFKSTFNNQMIEILTPMLDLPDNTTQHIRQLIAVLLRIDPLHEDAFKYKLKLYLQEGKHALAKQAFESFKKVYFGYYEEQFPHGYSEYVTKMN